MKLQSLSTLLATSVIAMSCASSTFAADYTLSINTALAVTDPLYKGLEALQASVAEASGGRMEVKLFPNSQLGPDEDVLEQAKAGAPVAVVVDGGRLANYVNEFGVLGAPYLASGYDGIRKVVTSEMFETWVVKLHDEGQLQVLSFNWWQGERELFTKKPVATPADLAGVRMRTPGAPVWMETVAAMGATPTPMPYSEVYPALQQNVLDAAEVQYPAAFGSKLFEVTKYITKTGHISLITGLVTSGPWFDTLPDDLKQILREESLKAGDIASRGTEASLDQLEADFKAQGMDVTTPDLSIFRAATAGVYDKLGYGALRDELQAIAAK